MVIAIDGIFKAYPRSIGEDQISLEDVRCIKACFHHLKKNGLSPHLQDNIKKVICNSEVSKEILEEVNKVPLTDKKEIGKMIEPVLADILHHYNPQEWI